MIQIFGIFMSMGTNSNIDLCRYTYRKWSFLELCLFESEHVTHKASQKNAVKHVEGVRLWKPRRINKGKTEENRKKKTTKRNPMNAIQFHSACCWINIYFCLQRKQFPVGWQSIYYYYIGQGCGYKINVVFVPI